MTTSRKVASKASDLLKNSRSDKVKSVAGSDLSQAARNKTSNRGNKSKGK